MKDEAERYDRIVGFKLSRLGRSARDVLNTIHELQQRGRSRQELDLIESQVRSIEFTTPTTEPGPLEIDELPGL